MIGFWECVLVSISSLWTHKLRSILTMIGIVIGIASVICVVAIGQGGEAMLKSQFIGVQNNVLQVIYREPQSDDSFFLSEQEKKREPIFDQQDITDLKGIKEIQRVITSNSAVSNAYFLNYSSHLEVLGVSQEYYQANPPEIIMGRQIQRIDVEKGRKVAVINEEVKEYFFKYKNPLGEILYVEGVPLLIIGVVKNEGNVFNFNTKRMVVPISIWPIIYEKDEIQSVMIQALNTDRMEAAGKKAIDFLNNKKKWKRKLEGSYDIVNLKQLQEAIANITRVMTAIISGIASISLIVGGIGVMNIMLVSVTERTKEIGIRKALGATKKSILSQFLIESVTLTTIGGIIGIMLGSLGALFISQIAKWPPLISVEAVLGAVCFSMVIGIIFGMMPAQRAANMQPIDALRYE